MLPVALLRSVHLEFSLKMKRKQDLFDVVKKLVEEYKMELFRLRKKLWSLPWTALGRRVRNDPREGGRNFKASSSALLFPPLSPGGRPGGSGGGRGPEGGGGCIDCIGIAPLAIIGTAPARPK